MTNEEKNILKITRQERSKIFKRAHALVKKGIAFNLSSALRRCYADLKAYKEKLFFDFHEEINKLRSLYNVNLEINESLNRAYLRGENIY
ncbi:MAG: hypothetical protein ACOWWH_12745 [Eubacteriaceae bacterium]